MFSRIAVVVTLVVVAVSATVSTQNRPRKWWQDEATMAVLEITQQQSADVEEIFQASRARLVDLKKTLDALEADLSAMVRERRDEAGVAAKLEDARSAMNKARTLMLYRMHRVLTPEQDKKLKELFDKWERERRGRSGGRHHTQA